MTRDARTESAKFNNMAGDAFIPILNDFTGNEQSGVYKLWDSYIDYFVWDDENRSIRRSVIVRDEKRINIGQVREINGYVYRRYFQPSMNPMWTPWVERLASFEDVTKSMARLTYNDKKKENLWTKLINAIWKNT